MAAQEGMFAVAIRDGNDLFLWIRIRRGKSGDIYYMFPTGRSGPEWKDWNPHGSHHKDGTFHHKSFDRKVFPQRRQKPDSNFVGAENLVTRGIASDEPRAFHKEWRRADFSTVMEVPAAILSPAKYETYVSIDLTERGGQPTIVSEAKNLLQQKLDESIPVILVSVYRTAEKAER
jgi:hypothetical protein